MRALIQRVKYARVNVDGVTVGSIDEGFLVLLGVKHSDTRDEADLLCRKLVGMRIFKDAAGKINKSLADIAGSVLIVPQFTLYANCVHGNRPDFLASAKPDIAEPLFRYFVDAVKQNSIPVQTGVFGADMKVELFNDGPFTVLLDTDELKGGRK